MHIASVPLQYILQMTLSISNVSRYTYTSDQRFRAIHKMMSQDYLLQILPVKVGPL